MFALVSLCRLQPGIFARIVHRHCRPRVASGMVFLTVVALTAGCGSGAFRGPSAGRPRPVTISSGSTSNGSMSPSSAGSPAPSAAVEEIHYGYHLPYGDTPNAQDDAVVYMYLLRGDCASAQNLLNDSWNHLGAFYGGPRMVVMYQAAIEMCRGNDSAARYFSQIAKTRYGWAGLAKDQYTCNIYRATRSVWWQRRLSSIKCRKSGDIPWWPGNRTCDDPRTRTNECSSAMPSVRQASPTPTAPATSTEPGTPSESASATPEAQATPSSNSPPASP